MATLNLSTNVPIDAVATSDILKDCTRTLAKIIGKPESVSFDHMDIAISKAFKSAVTDTIHSLPQHQQIILCAVVNFFHQFKKSATTLGEGLLKLGKSKEDKLKIVGYKGTDSFKIAWSSDEPK